MIKRLLTHLKGNSRRYGLLLSLFILGTIGAVALGNVYSDAGLAPPTVTSDKDDYAPGQVAHITGSGWTLDQSVHIEFKEEPDYPDYHSYDIPVNEDGTWKLDYNIEERHLGVKFTVTTTGKTTGTIASTSFTDAGIRNVTVAGTEFCAGQTVSVSFEAVASRVDGSPNGNFNDGNVFNIQLSDASGSFANPVTIGTRAGKADNYTVTATIPLNTAEGTKYRIQVVSTAPASNAPKNTVDLIIKVAPSSLSYSANTANYCVGTAITPNSPTSSGSTPTSYSISAALPAGLTFNTTTGIISGTPTTPSAATNYMVTATNACGSTSSVINIGVNSAPTFTACPSNITTNTVLGVCSAPVTYIATASGTPAPTYSYIFSGATTGTGTGTGSGATFNKGVTNVTVKATNACGSVECKFTITVNDNEAPVVPTLATATGECSVTVVAPTTTDNCAGTITGTTTDPLTYTKEGTYKVTFTFNDGNGNTSTATQTVVVDDVTAPVVPTLATATGECSVTVVAPTTTDNCAGTITGTTTDPLTYTKEGTYKVTFTFNDGNGNTSTATQTVVVDDVTAPVVTVPANIAVKNDAGACSAVVTYNVTASDNCSTVSPILTEGLASGAKFPVGTTTVTYTATDAAGNKTEESFTVKVDNTAPVLSAISGPIGPVAVGTPVTLSANYTDNNLTSGTFTFSIDGENYGNPKSATIANGKVSGTFTLPTGVYNVKLVITDACGATAEIIYGGFVVVYDPNGGFVTGGGWIYSNPGSLPSKPLAQGTANFGFNAKYKNGKNDVAEVDGSTNFQFKEGDFHFKSSSHDAMSLVVAGRKATYRGTGTVNGEGTYKFMVTVIDGNLTGGDGIDKFRIRIVGAGSPDEVIYDNEMGILENADAVTALGSGSIVIHKPTTSTPTKERVADAADMFNGTQPTFKAYPNPIRDNATIEFAFAQDEEYTLAIYDVRGQLVKQLPGGSAKANAPVQVKWEDASAANGVYIIRLVTKNGVQNLRVIREK